MCVIHLLQVSLSFDATTTLRPRDNVTLTVTAHPGSYVGLLAVDKSVRLLRSGNDLSQDEVRVKQRSSAAAEYSTYDKSAAIYQNFYKTCIFRIKSTRISKEIDRQKYVCAEVLRINVV